ncbi:hypothetical protein D910_03615, partial [Dendroctonus ponderosae]
MSKRYIGYEPADPYKASLLLVNIHHTLNGVTALPPNVIEVGGIHVVNKKPKKLPQDIENWINNSEHGVIYFSLGSMIKGHTFPEEQRKAFIRAFAKLPQRILWKWENETMLDKPDNVMISKWMPQFDILKGRPTAEKHLELVQWQIADITALFPDQEWILQQDNAPIHTAQIIQTWLTANNISVLEWPAIFPDLNNIENLWDGSNQVSRTVYRFFKIRNRQKLFLIIRVAECIRIPGHSNVKVFISHGGMLGTIEAIFNGKPIIIIPHFGDQAHNARNLERKEVGIFLDMHDATEGAISAALQKALNSKILEKVKSVSEQFRDRPMSPMDSAIYWVEYVAKHRETLHMRSEAIDVPFYQYYLIDVATFLFGIIASFLFTLYKIAKLILR